MRRVSHEMGGLAERLGRLAEQLEQEGQLTQEVWRDQRGEAFLRERIFPFQTHITQLMASISETSELFEELVKRLSDPDASK
ncbi:MAG: hypothetical protein ACTHK7_04945 [Aureliella sp.]